MYTYGLAEPVCAIAQRFGAAYEVAAIAETL